jgi:hypothetical protein
MLWTVGVAVTFVFAVLAALLFGPLSFFVPWVVLFFAFWFGLGWDVLYVLLQRLRWERDWPPIFDVVAGFVEALPLLLVARLLGAPGWFFWLHYVAVWLTIFLIVHGPIRVLFPRWRYRGGRWI